MPAVTVVIPTLRGRQWLPACLDALRAQTFADFEVVVIDNASADGSAEWLAAQPGLRVLRNASNIGFAAAVNQGIRASTAPYIALLNDDTRVDPNWLAALRHAMQAEAFDTAPRPRAADPETTVGMCASLMLFADRPDIVQSAGIAVDRAAIAWDRLGGHRAGEALEPCEVFGPSGGAALYRRAMLDEIGLFDERFFAYLEDVDLAWRAQRAGWRCRYVPDARVLHATSATSVQGSRFKNRLLGRNKVWLAMKNSRVRDLPVVAAYDLAAVVYAGLARGEWAHLKGRLDGLAHPVRRAAAGIAEPPFDPLVAPWRVPARMNPPAALQPAH